MIIFEIEHFFGISQGFDQFLLGSIKGELVECGLLVLGKCVVHVEANGFEVVESEFAVAEYAGGGDGVMGGEVGDGGEGEVEVVEEGRVAGLGRDGGRG